MAVFLGDPDMIKELIEKLTASLDVADEVWDYKRVAKELGYKESTIQTMVSRGRIPYRKVENSKTMFLKSDIIAWVRTGKASFTHQIPDAR